MSNYFLRTKKVEGTASVYLRGPKKNPKIKHHSLHQSLCGYPTMEQGDERCRQME